MIIGVIFNGFMMDFELFCLFKIAFKIFENFWLVINNKREITIFTLRVNPCINYK